MQKKLNENFYILIQKNIRQLALKSSNLSYGELKNEFNLIQDKVFWSNWGLQGNLTKKALVEYLDTINSKLNKESKGIKFLGIYLFDKQVKDCRKRMQKQYIVDFKE